MKSVKTFKLNFGSPKELPLDVYHLPFSFEQIEKFKIDFPYGLKLHSSFMEQIYKFIDKHPTITAIDSNIQSLEIVNWSRLAEMLPLLTAISLPSCPLSTDQVIEIMAKFQMLQKFQYKLTVEYSSLSKRLGYKWEGNTCYGSVKLNRRF